MAGDAVLSRNRSKASVSVPLLHDGVFGPAVKFVHGVREKNHVSRACYSQIAMANCVKFWAFYIRLTNHVRNPPIHRTSRVRDAVAPTARDGRRYVPLRNSGGVLPAEARACSIADKPWSMGTCSKPRMRCAE